MVALAIISTLITKHLFDSHEFRGDDYGQDYWN